MRAIRSTSRTFIGRSLVILIFSIFLLLSIQSQPPAAATTQVGGEGEALFTQICAACHTIGKGVLVGPDLAGVFERRERDWIESFISAPDQMLANGDSTASELLAEFNNIPMPNPGLSKSQVESLLVFLESGESVDRVAAPLPAGSAARGRDIFVGSQPLENNGTPCMACHTVSSVGAFGGGSLGPDLTHALEIYGDPGLAGAMQTIAFPTMQGVYATKPLTDQEVANLLAFFKNTNYQGGADAALGFTPIFWGAGIVGAGLLFGLMGIFWPRQRENLTDRLRRNAGITSRRDS